MVNTVPSDYVTGTITLTNGSNAFTGTGTGWLAMMFRQGDLILDLPDAPEYIAIIDEVTSNTAGVLTRPWLGPTLTGAYRMRYQWDAGRVTAMSAFLREELGNGNLQAFAALVGSAGGVPVFIGPGAMEIRPATDFITGVAYDVQVDTLADRAAFDGQSEGFAVLVSDVGDGRSALFFKASNAVGDWTDPAYITGPTGAAPAFAAGATTTVPPGTPANVDVVPDGSGGYLFDFDIPAGEGFAFRGVYSGATAYVLGDVVRDNNSSWIALQATTGNAPPVLPTTSNTWWELLAAAGANGAGTVSSVVAGIGIAVNSTDPTAPIVSAMGDTFINIKEHYGVVGGFDAGDAAKIQTAFDDAPRGSTLVFPQDDYKTDVPLVISQLLNLKLHHSRLRGDFTNPNDDVLRVNVTGEGIGDVRGMHVDGGLISCNGGGNCAINVNSTEDDWYPHFGMLIENGMHSGRLRAIRIGASNAAGDTNFNTIRNNNLEVQVSGGVVIDLDGCADGNRVIDNLIWGPSAGIRVDLQEGAFNTAIRDNGIVARDGGVILVNASRVNITGNQFEQQGGLNGLGVSSAHILIQGLSYICAGNIIKENNFGGGPNINNCITIYNGRGTVIDENQFNAGSVGDIWFADDSGFTAKFNTVGPNNWMRGTRSLITNARTDITRRMVITEAAGCVGNRGFWKPGSSMTFANSWSPDAGFAYMQDQNGIVHFQGTVSGGTVTLGTTIFTMPLGYVPMAFMSLPIVNASGAYSYVGVSSANGGVSTGVGLPAAPTTVNLGHVSYPTNYLSSYDIGP